MQGPKDNDAARRLGCDGTSQALRGAEVRLGVLIHAETVEPQLWAPLARLLADRGEVSVVNAYADWSSPAMAGWLPVLRRHGIQVRHQFRARTTQDPALVAITMDAIELLTLAPSTSWFSSASWDPPCRSSSGSASAVSSSSSLVRPRHRSTSAAHARSSSTSGHCTRTALPPGLAATGPESPSSYATVEGSGGRPVRIVQRRVARTCTRNIVSSSGNTPPHV